MEIENQYKIFLESGELKELFPGMKGVWEKDEKRFTKIHQEMQKALNIKVNL